MHSIGRLENENEYLSDVQGPSSIAPSDSEATTYQVSDAFRQKYNFLREAYEDRLKHLSSVIENACSSFWSDDIVVNMSALSIWPRFSSII